jgi:hypothetical protein
MPELRRILKKAKLREDLYYDACESVFGKG